MSSWVSETWSQHIKVYWTYWAEWALSTSEFCFRKTSLLCAPRKTRPTRRSHCRCLGIFISKEKSCVIFVVFVRELFRFNCISIFNLLAERQEHFWGHATHAVVLAGVVIVVKRTSAIVSVYICIEQNNKMIFESKVDDDDVAIYLVEWLTFSAFLLHKQHLVHVQVAEQARLAQIAL